MSLSSIVLIARSDLLISLSQGLDGTGDVLAFSDTDALPALEAIAERRPTIVVLDRQFASTPRGSALISRIKADPALIGSEIRVVASEGDATDLRQRRALSGAAIAGNPLDPFGTRRTERFPVDDLVEALVDGHTATVVDLSTTGAQVVSSKVLKPNQLVRVSLSDKEQVLRLDACIAWSSFEMPAVGEPRYRAGIEFLDANASALRAYSQRHRTA